MRRWRIAAVGLALTAAAVGGGVAVWSASGDNGASCDRIALTQSITDGMRRAEADEAVQFMPDATAGCHYEEMSAAAQEITREWHMMPGGMMMRSPGHTSR
jgi:hypothetical protein